MPIYTLPDLDYDYGALEPHVSARIMELHHDKHHAAYVKGANTALERLGEPVERGVGALDVGGVVLVVVQLHDPRGDVRLERAVVVAKLRKRVGGHCAFLPWLSDRSDSSPVRHARDR